MKIRDGFIGTVGNTPLIKLRRASEETGCTILGKAEFLNPGGSVKDRPARHIIQDAEERGELRAGGVIVESTAGNTGIGLALVGNARGYRTVIVIPETQSQEKKDMLRLCGAELIEVPAVPYSNPNNISTSAGDLPSICARANPTASFWADQWNNLDNRKAITRRPGRRSGRIPRADRRLYLLDRHRRHALRRQHLPEERNKHRHRRCRPAGRGMYNFFTTARKGGGQLDHGRHQPRAHHQNVADIRVDRPTRSPIPRRYPISSISRA